MDLSPEFNGSLINILTYILTDDKIHLEGEGEHLEKWVDDLYRLNVQGLNPFDHKFQRRPSPGMKLLIVLREALLSQRWVVALKLIRNVIKEHSTMAQATVRAFLEILHHIDPSRRRLMEQLLEHMQQLTGICARELTLEYVFFLLSQPNSPPLIEEALNVFTLFQTKKKTAVSERDRQLEDVLYEAYRGLLYHAQWLLVKQKVDAQDADADDIGNLHERQMMESLAEKAEGSLAVVESHKGVFDIFVTKHVQLLEHRGDNTRAQELLEAYLMCNHDNPNAHRYLAEFHLRNDHLNQAIASLTDLAGLLPADESVLELYDLHRRKGSGLLMTFPLLLDLLDHVEWQDSVRAWRHLTEDLIDILDSDYDEETASVIQTMFDSHMSWWPQYHFTLYNARRAVATAGDVGSNSKLLLVYKAAVASVCHVAPEFVAVVKSHVAEDEFALWILDKADVAGRQLCTEES